MKYIVTRSNWLRGEDYRSRLLRVSDGKMCCLGHVALQCGMYAVDIADKDAPQVVSLNVRGRFPKWIFTKSIETTSPDGFHAMGINDDPDISDPEREAKLKEIFARNGDELEFIN